LPTRTASEGKRRRGRARAKTKGEEGEKERDDRPNPPFIAILLPLLCPSWNSPDRPPVIAISSHLAFSLHLLPMHNDT